MPGSSRPATHAEQLEALALELMLDPTEAKTGFASYIDLLWRERSVFASAHQQQDRLDRIVRRAQRLPHREAALECVLRPAVLDLNGPLEGFSVSLYVTALGPEAAIAHRRWELALEDVVALLRGKRPRSPPRLRYNRCSGRLSPARPPRRLATTFCGPTHGRVAQLDRARTF